MSSSIRITQKIDAMIVIDDVLLPNSYDVSFTIAMHTNNVYEQNVVIERLRFIADTMLSGAVIINHDNSITQSLRSLFPNNNFVILDAAPYDSVVVNIFYLKAQSLLEEYATIESMSLCSNLGQEIEYFADSDDDFTDHANCSWLPKSQSPWWLNANTLTSDIEGVPEITWDEVGLGWNEPKENTESSKISETTIIKFPKFEPKIVQGELNGT